MEEEACKAMSHVRPPDEFKPPTLHEMLPGLALLVDQLGRVASSLGLRQDLTEGLKTHGGRRY